MTTLLRSGEVKINNGLQMAVTTSLLKNGDLFRWKSNIHLNETQCEVPVPLFKQAARP